MLMSVNLQTGLRRGAKNSKTNVGRPMGGSVGPRFKSVTSPNWIHLTCDFLRHHLLSRLLISAMFVGDVVHLARKVWRLANEIGRRELPLMPLARVEFLPICLYSYARRTSSAVAQIAWPARAGGS